MKPAPLFFSVLRYQPDMQRQEVVNVGIVLFTQEEPRVSLGTNLGKVLALDPNFRVAQIYEQAKRLQHTLSALGAKNLSPPEIVERFANGGTLSLSPTGMIDRTGRTIESIIEELEHDLVRAPVPRRLKDPRTSRLHSELRRVFAQGKILGSKPSDIDKHLVVPNFPIDPDVGLFAEFALRNGKLHITETVDFRTAPSSTKRTESQAKTLLLVQALASVGAKDLKRYVVVTGVSSQVQPSINLLSRFADDLIVRESAEDWLRYVDAMHAAAKPDPLQIQ
jgi:hypothetical protein